MKNKDLQSINKEELKSTALKAIKDGNAEEFLDTIQAYFENLANEVKADYESVIASNDAEILSKRGFRVLTSKEEKYYKDLANAMKTNSGLTDIEMPRTIIDRVFEDLEKDHELLQKINFQNVTGITEMIVRNGDAEAAWWGELTEKIKKELASAFKKITVNALKLSAYLPVAKAHLDLGPVYLDAFVRRFLLESLAIGLENAIVTGDGNKKPIGMDRNLDGSVVGGVYPQKDVRVITKLDLATLGGLMASLTNDGKRKVPSALFIVNPFDYYATILPNIYYRTSDGRWVSNLPFPIDFVQSCEVAKGKAIMGIAKNYFMGLGSQQKILKSDDYHFIEDETVYLAKMYGVGQPIDNTSFLYLDISKIGTVEVPMSEKIMLETEEVLGKEPSELMENGHIFDDGSVVGTFNKVDNFTKFSSKPEEQSGYYFPIKLVKNGEKMTIKKNGKEVHKNIPYDNSIVLRVTSSDTFEIIVDNESIANFNFKYATFDASPAV